jgi:hypothetical protein
MSGRFMDISLGAERFRDKLGMTMKARGSTRRLRLARQTGTR